MRELSAQSKKIVRDRQFRRAMNIIKSELRHKGFNLLGVKFPEAARIYAKEVYGEEFFDFKEWVLAKVDEGYLNKYTQKQTITTNTEPRLPKLKKSEKKYYHEFLRSKYWEKVRDMVLFRDGFTCKSCGSNEKLRIHHLTYKNHLYESEHLDDLITLCESCHNEIHGRVGGKNTIPLNRYESIYDFAK